MNKPLDQSSSCEGNWYMRASPKLYCWKSEVAVLARWIRSVLKRYWNFWWIFDFRYDKQHFTETLITTWSPMIKIRTLPLPLPSCSCLFDFGNPFFFLRCLKFYIKKMLSWMFMLPQAQILFIIKTQILFKLLRFGLSKSYIRFWQAAYIL